MKNSKKIIITAIASIAIFQNSFATEKNKEELKGKTIPAERAESLEITANSSDIDYEKKELVFIGDVQVKDPQVELNADRLVILFDANEDIKSFQAFGNDNLINILLRRDGTDVKAKGDSATYDAKTGEIILAGESTSLTEGRNSVKGAKKIVFFMNKEGISDFKTIGRSKFIINRSSGLLKKADKKDAGK